MKPADKITPGSLIIVRGAKYKTVAARLVITHGKKRSSLILSQDHMYETPLVGIIYVMASCEKDR